MDSTNHLKRKNSHPWLKTAAWTKGLRLAVLAEQPECRVCLALFEQHRISRIELSTEVDHIVPHNGDAKLFWDRNNLQGLCKSHHSEKTLRENLGLKPIDPNAPVPTGEQGKQFTAGSPSKRKMSELMADVADVEDL